MTLERDVPLRRVALRPFVLRCAECNERTSAFGRVWREAKWQPSTGERGLAGRPLEAVDLTRMLPTVRLGIMDAAVGGVAVCASQTKIGQRRTAESAPKH